MDLYYQQGKKTDTKNVCFRVASGEIFVHLMFLETCFEFFRSYSEQEDNCLTLYYHTWTEIGKNIAVPKNAISQPLTMEKNGDIYIVKTRQYSLPEITVLMQCIYGIEIDDYIKSILRALKMNPKRKFWDFLLGVFNLYETLNPTAAFAKVFEEKYQPLIIKYIMENISKEDVFPVLAKIEGKNLNCLKKMTFQLLEIHKEFILVHIVDHALQQHTNSINSKIETLSYQTRCIMHNYYFKNDQAQFGIK